MAEPVPASPTLSASECAEHIERIKQLYDREKTVLVYLLLLLLLCSLSSLVLMMRFLLRLPIDVDRRSRPSLSSTRRLHV